MFYFRLHTHMIIMFLYFDPVLWSHAAVGYFLDVFGELVCSTERVFKFADAKLFLTVLFHWIGEEAHPKGTLVYFVKFDPHYQSYVKRKKKKTVMHSCLAFVACEIVLSFVYLWY